jgi:hypothetical protein
VTSSAIARHIIGASSMNQWVEAFYAPHARREITFCRLKWALAQFW